MKYGKQICIGMFLLGMWSDFDTPKFDLLPVIKPFKYADGTDGYWLMEDFKIRIKDKIFIVKKGFDFDGASIPKWLWGVIGSPVDTTKLVAALLHDVIYASNILKQKEADALFLEVLEAFDEKWVIRNNCWMAVRGFGWTKYPKKQEEKDKYLNFVQIVNAKELYLD